MSFLDTIKGMFGITPPMSDEERAHLNAIAEQPTADEPRLAYADFLEGKKDPRGRFIRLQVAAARLPEGEARRGEMEGEAEVIASKHGKKWVRPLKELELEPVLMSYYLPSLWYQRGMIEELTIDKRGIIPGKLDRLLELAPTLHTVAFARCSPDYAAIAAASRMRQITNLSLADVKPSVNDLRTLAASPNLAQLETLDLSGKAFGEDLARVLAESKAWTRLKSLKLGSCQLGPTGAGLLAQAANLKTLEELDLAYNSIGDEGVAALAASPHLRNLHKLTLRSNGLTSAAVTALAGAPWKLTALDLESNNIDGAGVAALSKTPACQQLRSLNISWNRGEDANAGLIAWANSPALAHVTEWLAVGNELTDACLAAIAASPHTRNLRNLDLSANLFTDVGPLVQAADRLELTKLSIRCDELTDDDYAQLDAAFCEGVVER